MTRTVRRLAVLCVLWACFLPGVSAAGPDGAALYRAYRCALCHGPAGCTPARDTYPVIAGQNRAYLVRQMLDIQTGARYNGSSRVMRNLIETLTRPEAEAIAAYLAHLEPVPGIRGCRKKEGASGGK